MTREDLGAALAGDHDVAEDATAQLETRFGYQALLAAVFR
jgi:hypothetical protein